MRWESHIISSPMAVLHSTGQLLCKWVWVWNVFKMKYFLLLVMFLMTNYSFIGVSELPSVKEEVNDSTILIMADLNEHRGGHKYFATYKGNPLCVAWGCGNDHNCCLPEIVIVAQ